MSDNSVLATPNTATLSVIRTFMSVPSRDLIIRLAPSTLSMVPRIRTVGGCCAHAAVPNTDTIISEAASARGSDEEIFSMALSLTIFFRQRMEHHSGAAIPSSPSPLAGEGG